MFHLKTLFHLQVYSLAFGSISNPFPEHGNLESIVPKNNDVKRTKAFHNSTPDILNDVEMLNYKAFTCGIKTNLEWSSDVGSAVYSPPVIFPSGKNGKKKIFVSTFYQSVEILGHDGYKPWGWPVSFDGSSFQGSPILYDIDGDGSSDLGVVDKNANLYWIRVGDFGQYLDDFHVQVPKLKVKRDWFAGLDPSFVDNYVLTSMFDNRYEGRKGGGAGKADGLEVIVKQDTYPELRPPVGGARKILSSSGNVDHGNVDHGVAGVVRGSGRTLMDVQGEEEGQGGGVEDAEIEDADARQINAVKSIVSNRGKSEKEVEKEGQQEEKEVGGKEEGQEEGGGKDISEGPGQVAGGGQGHGHLQEGSLAARDREVEEQRREQQVLRELQEQEEAEERAGGAGAEAGGGAREVVHEEVLPRIVEVSEDVPQPLLPEEGGVADIAGADVDRGDAEFENADDQYRQSILRAQADFDFDQGQEHAAGDVDNLRFGEGEGQPETLERQPYWEEGGGPENVAVDDYIPRQAGEAYSVQRHAYMGDDFYGRGGYGGGFWNDSTFVYVDPHVLSSPVLADVNGDGNMEIIMAVSYYFDKAEYAGKDLDFDPSMFIAGGVACWNIQNELWSWLVHLDLTTDKTQFKALIHGSPTVVDLDGDGRAEVVVGTSLGLLYVLDGVTGFVRRYFPMQFHEIQSQVAVADVVGGANLEIIVTDMAGNVVCVDTEGEVVWDRRLSGSIPHTATIGDVNGDGVLDIVVSTVSKTGYHIYALRGDNGKTLFGYPIAMPAGGAVSAPIILADLHRSSRHTQADLASTLTEVLSPDAYADPDMLPWMQHSAGHQPAPAPSMVIDARNDTEESSRHESTSLLRRGKHNRGGKRGKEDSALDGEEGHEGGESEGEGWGGGNQSEVVFGRGGGRARHLSKHASHGKKNMRGMHLLVPSFDGHLYILDGRRRCAQRIDVGEHIYSTPLIDDVNGDGSLDIVLGTLSGHIHMFATNVAYHPLNAWTSFPKYRGGNGFTHGVTGISIPALEKKLLEYSTVRGSRQLAVVFDIWDTRKNMKSGDRKYVVVLTRGTNMLEPLGKFEFSSPGRYTVHLGVSPPEAFSLLLGMTNDHGQYFEDQVYVEISTRFHVWIKYLVLFPVALLCLPLLVTLKASKY